MHLDPALISWDYQRMAMKFSLLNAEWETLNHQLRRDNLFTTFRFSSHFQFLRPNQLQTSSVINCLNLFVGLISLFNKFGGWFWLLTGLFEDNNTNKQKLNFHWYSRDHFLLILLDSWHFKFNFLISKVQWLQIWFTNRENKKPPKTLRNHCKSLRLLWIIHNLINPQ